MKKILIIDDELSQRELLCAVMENDGYSCVSTPDGNVSVDLIGKHSISLVLLDMRMPKLDGLETLDLIHKHFSKLPVVMVTAHGDVKTAVDAMKRGAVDFIEKPVDITRLRNLVNGLLNNTEPGTSPEQASAESTGFIGVSKAAEDIRELCKVSARSNATILITGESGTGKEVIARATHAMSPRSAGPFVAINCAAVPEQLLESEIFGHEKGAFTGAIARKIGRFETAHGGTILLDEIAEMRSDLQSKLLRVLQERSLERVGGTASIPVDVRVIAATNTNVEEALDEGTLRDDLFYRLNVLRIAIPPLRERPEDIIPLARHFLTKHGAGKPRRLTEATIKRLNSYNWPGNARELENTIERSLLFAKGQDILPEHLPPQLGGRNSQGTNETGVRPGWSLQEVERDLILKTLRVNNNNRTLTARALGMSRRSLQMKIKKFEIN